MHHLFLGIVPDSLVHAPYNPAISQGLMFPAEKFHLGIHPGGQLVALPVIAGFVGADTVACLLAVNLEEEEKDDADDRHWNKREKFVLGNE